MKKIINFDKVIEFPTMIGEITSISLEDYLRFKDSSNIVGKFIVKGTYKRTEATRLEEDFSFDLPTEIILTEKLDLETSTVEIDDFYYEIENDDTINCHISVLVEGVEIVDFDEKEELPLLEEHEEVIDNIIIPEENEEVRECDGDNTYEEEYIEAQKEAVEEKVVEDNDVGSLFTSLKDSEETFSTYSVYIMRNEESIESILTKYKITKDELENYNDLNNVGVGTKLIIPLHENN